MTTYEVYDAGGVLVHKYSHTFQIDYSANWPGCTQVALPPPEPEPEPEPPQPTPVRITKLAFRNRFTADEKIAIEIAALDDPAASMQQRSMSAALRAQQADVAVATYIDLNRVDTRAGVQQLEAVGLIAAGRAAEILDTAPTSEEVWNG
jgi:hypothetical protein